MDHPGQFKRQPLLGLVQLCALQCLLHFLDLLNGDKGQKLHALDDIGVIHVPPVLEEIVRRGLFRIQPDCAGLGLAHLFALGVQKEGNGHGAGVLPQLLPDQLRAAQHIAPLVVAAELQVAAVPLVEAEEVVALHDHVVKL